MGIKNRKPKRNRDKSSGECGTSPHDSTNPISEPLAHPLKPVKFPMKFKECLRRIIGGRLHGERLRLFRKHWASLLKQFENMDYATLECIKTDEGRTTKANEMIEKFTRDGVDEYWFNSLSNSLPKWRVENRIQQRKDAAQKRWKGHVKKSIDGTE